MHSIGMEKQCINKNQGKDEFNWVLIQTKTDNSDESCKNVFKAFLNARTFSV
jgi:hypothetical protein